MKRVTVIASVAAVGAAAVITMLSTAGASPSAAAPKPHLPVIKRSQLPRGAVRATHGLFATGTHRALFSAQQVHTNVVGGVVANASDYPSVVGVETFFLVEDNGVFTDWMSTCTGTVLSPTKILTAGHCVIIGGGLMTTQVIAGRNDIDNDITVGTVADVASVYTDQAFNIAAMDSDQTGTVAPKDDVAVITLKTPLPAQYTPVTLTAQGDQTPYAQATGSVVGYGVTATDSPSAGVLYKADLPIQSDATCAGAYPGQFDAATMVCAGDTTNHVNACHGDSGGPLFIGGAEAGIVDWGGDTCENSYGVFERLSHYNTMVTADLTRNIINLDITGDGHSDLVLRPKDSSLPLQIWGGSGLASDGFGGLALPTQQDDTAAWAHQYNKLFRVTNWTGDFKESLMAEASGGNLYQYAIGARGQIAASGTLIGTGWNKFADIMVTNNWTGDGHPNLMARKSNGELWLYTSNGHGGWLNPHGTLIGTGWQKFNTVLTPGDWLGDGHQALIGRTSVGALVLYESDGHGGWVQPHGLQIGSGWNTFTIFMSPGDWNGDNLVDLIGVTSAGVAKLYETNGHGTWLNSHGTQINKTYESFWSSAAIDRLF